MEEKTLTDTTFGTYIKLHIHLFFSLGFGFGVILLILSLFGGDVYANLGPLQLTGIQAGIASVFLGPPIMMIIGIILSLIAYLPFKLYIKIIKGIKITGTWS